MQLTRLCSVQNACRSAIIRETINMIFVGTIRWEDVDPRFEVENTNEITFIFIYLNESRCTWLAGEL